MHHTLREAAKVGVGLILADLVSVFWFSTAGFFPLTVLGVRWTSSAVLPIVAFDLALIFLLIHYGWNTHAPIHSRSERTLLFITGTVFLIVALLHLARLAFDWSLIVGTFAVPLWLSWCGVVVTAYLSYTSFHFALRRKR